MGVGGQRRESAILSQGITRATEPVWTDAKNRAPTGIQSLDPPARSESLCRLLPSTQRTVGCLNLVQQFTLQTTPVLTYLSVDTLVRLFNGAFSSQ